MSATGRLRSGLGARAGGVVFGGLTTAELVEELALTTEIDRAHLVMLHECGLLDRASAAALLGEIGTLRATSFAALHALPRPRGVYLMYEQHLTDVLGPDVGGRLHTGRSRNDLNATAAALRLRERALELAGEVGRLLGVLLSRARVHRATTMPVHTHFQPAMPVTYGYHLVGVALAVGRDLAVLRSACEDGQRRSPLGAGAVAGTELPIDPARTARLLGFDRGPVHALDAVASRDALLRAVGAAAGIAVTLSRLATDLQLWSTGEFGFVTFPERLVGSSSAMPQKRNAFLLEHVKGAAATAIGSWTATATATKSVPFTNSIEVGTEAARNAWPGLRAVTDAVVLSQLLVSGAVPDPAVMRRRAEDGFVTATAVANLLVGRGVAFRTAHHAVGEAVRRAVDARTTRLTGTGTDVVPDVDQAARLLVNGGGPGAFEDGFAEAARIWAEHRAWLALARAAAAAAAGELVEAVADLTGGSR
jgi:argininosuccinate lyase